MSQRTLLIWFFASFILLGISATLLGPTLNDLATRFDLPLQNGGIFITLHSTGVTVSLLLVGRLFESGRFAPRYLLCIGPSLTALGLLVLATTSNNILGYVAAFTFGLGFGGILIGPNVLVAVLNPGNSASQLNALNMFFGVGAIIGPQVVNLAFALDNATLAYIFTALAALVFIPAFLRVDLPASIAAPQNDPNQPKVTVNWLLFVPFMALLFAYVGAEVGFGAWIATQLTEVVGTTAQTATIGVSLFWAGLTAGRGIAILVARYLRPLHLLMLSTVIMLVGVMLLLNAGNNQFIALLSAAMVGLGCGPVFPTTVAAISDNYPEQFSAVSGVVISVGNGGAMFLPWVQGQIGGGDTGGMTLTLVLTLVMLGILILLERQVRVTRTAQATA